MAQKPKIKSKKQAVPSSDYKEADTPKPWPNFPPQIIGLIARESSLMQKLHSKGVTKSWRTQSKNCKLLYTISLPWLQLSQGCTEESQQDHYSRVAFKRGEWIWYPRWRNYVGAPYYQYLGCSHGLIFQKLLSPAGYLHDEPRITLYEPINEFRCYVPQWDLNVPFAGAALSSPRYEDCILVWTGITNPALLYHGRGNRSNAWKEIDNTTLDPHCFDPSEPRHLMRFTNGIGFQGRLYVLSLQGTLVVIEEINSELCITGLGKKRAVPSVSCMHFRECMIESNGEILLIFLISRKSINVVDDVEVYKLDIDHLSWVKKGSIGDRALFLGSDCCTSVLASQLGAEETRSILLPTMGGGCMIWKNVACLESWVTSIFPKLL